MEKIIVVFKTHLDLGFTDLAENVLENYRTRYLPQAMRVAREMRGEKEGFVWTTGSWLIWDYLNHGDNPDMLEDAIRHGEIRWHGLPFTVHSELMDRELFDYGLHISGELDQKFGKHTIAAKLTDVPGHTRGIVPLLSRAGIRFLHIGVNPASTAPDVPGLFRWRSEQEEEVIVMYHHDYGQMTEIGNSGCWVYFAHTGDNSGPQSAESVREVYRSLHEKYPEARLVAGTLEDVALVALAQREQLPVIDGEIGDTWIHGTGSDPGKVSAYRALLRLARTLPEEEKNILYRELLPIPEHTWGLDEKTWLGKTREVGYLLGEHENFRRKEFDAVRSTPKYQHMEASWREQRAYLENAVQALPEEIRGKAREAIASHSRQPRDLTGFCKTEPNTMLDPGGFKVVVNDQGAVSFLEKDGRILADSDHLLAKFCYEVFSENEFERFRKQYVTCSDTWAIEDFGKIGMCQAIDAHRIYEPEADGVYRKENEVVVRMTLPKETKALYGGMEMLELSMVFREERVEFDFAWFGKHASRIAEASWLKFAPPENIRYLDKLGERIAPDQVIRGGNQRLHAVGEGVHFETMMLSTLDAPLINLGEPSLLLFSDEKPPIKDGLCVNLHNNVWGTNFVMWYEEDARFRFALDLSGKQD
ncbi:MAG: DUF5054 domain-containing protein [Fusicatenibacter sp.]